MSDPALAPWCHRDLVVSCGPDCPGTPCRRVEHAAAVVQAMDLEHLDRYLPGTYGKDGTRCNIGLTDYTRARGCEIPHWVGPDGVEVPDFRGHEQGANLMQLWVDTPTGRGEGWSPAGVAEVREAVNAGKVGSVGWLHLGGIGHVGIVLPTYADSPEVLIAQAGKTNFSLGPLSRGFGRLPVRFWVHS